MMCCQCEDISPPNFSNPVKFTSLQFTTNSTLVDISLQIGLKWILITWWRRIRNERIQLWVVMRHRDSKKGALILICLPFLQQYVCLNYIAMNHSFYFNHKAANSKMMMSMNFRTLATNKLLVSGNRATSHFLSFFQNFIIFSSLL